MAAGDTAIIKREIRVFREDPEEYITRLAFEKDGRSRHTQNSPILPDVLVHYATGESDARLDLLLSPYRSNTPARLARDLVRMMGKRTESQVSGGQPDEHAIAYNQSVVAVHLGFRELLSCVLPLSDWWQTQLLAAPSIDLAQLSRNDRLKGIARFQLVEGLKDEFESRFAAQRRQDWLFFHDFVWAARVFWVVCHSGPSTHPEEIDHARNIEPMADFALEFIVAEPAKRLSLQDKAIDAPAIGRPSLYSVNRNRTVEQTSLDSLATTKADAAARTFRVYGEKICWAIIDTGVDAAHPAFQRHATDAEGGDEQAGAARPAQTAPGLATTRVKETYDFSNIRKHLTRKQQQGLLAGSMLDWDALLDDPGDDSPIRIPHTDGQYRTPANAHGTHVAGILAADWRPSADDVDPLGPPPNRRQRQERFRGLCPKIELYDLRVFQDDGTGDEFSVISAMQFVRNRNQKHDVQEIHGVNLSLAMHHEVSNYACGRSPVCEECARLAGSGVVVVAAAGNEGRSIHMTTAGRRQEGYRSISITDPGNAEAVITVGSTHRQHAHTYGVSYFSSRGPTGDGRLKPDLVAPGEKIHSTTPGTTMATMGGTSQAAPHVSGAAALLMSRYRELVGDPQRIKQILMSTATDLGREPYFQGAGLVDILRAMQSI